MFVTNHVLSGVAIGRALRRRPVAAFACGVVSHLALDAVPHWGCSTTVPGGAERFLAVARRDGLLALAVLGACAVASERSARRATVAAMVGAALLDLDKPVEHFFGFDPFPAAVSRLHRRVQNESREGMPNELAVGSALAAADALGFVRDRRRAGH